MIFVPFDSLLSDVYMRADTAECLEGKISELQSESHRLYMLLPVGNSLQV